MKQFMVRKCIKIGFMYLHRSKCGKDVKPHVSVVSSPDCHALWAKDSLEQLLQILGPRI